MIYKNGNEVTGIQRVVNGVVQSATSAYKVVAGVGVLIWTAIKESIGWFSSDGWFNNDSW